MKKNSFVLLVCIFLVFSASCQEASYSPWGIWNSYSVSNADNIRKLSYGQFYEAGDSGLWILEDCAEHVPGDYTGPAFTTTGDYVVIEKIEVIKGGFIFSFMGKGRKQDPITGISKWQNNTRASVRMEFLSENDCRFIFEKKDPNGFILHCMPKEKIIYHRLMVNAAP